MTNSPISLNDCRKAFDAWWNGIEAYSLRAERFTTPEEGAWAAWQVKWHARSEMLDNKNEIEEAFRVGKSVGEIAGKVAVEALEKVRYERDKLELAYNALLTKRETLHPALINAAEILVNFKTEGNKLEEWQACYAKLFTQMTEMVATKRESSVDKYETLKAPAESICRNAIYKRANDEEWYEIEVDAIDWLKQTLKFTPLSEIEAQVEIGKQE